MGASSEDNFRCTDAGSDGTFVLGGTTESTDWPTLNPTQSAYAGDLAIAQEIAAGNRALFKEVYERNVHTLFNLARRMADSAAEAEDIVQDAFIRAYQKIHLFAGRSTLSSWLYRICVNVGLESLRRKKGTFEDINDSNCGTTEPDQKKEGGS